MNTPTPRTDEARRIDNGDTHPLLDEMETMERELAAERAKVRTLREACECICEEWGCNHDANPFGAGNRMDRHATAALEATEGPQ